MNSTIQLTMTLLHLFLLVSALVFSTASTLPKLPIMSNIKLTYFNIAGRAEPVRLALAMQGLAFEDVRINFADFPALKATLKHGKLPFMTIDGRDYYESVAMMKYVARMKPSTLYPQDLEEQFKVDEALSVAMDFEKRIDYARELGMRPQYYGYAADFTKTPEGQEFLKAVRTNFVATFLPEYLTTFATMIESNGGVFLTGSDVTIADLFVYRLLKGLTAGVMDYIPTDCLNGNAAMLSYIERIEAVPQIATWNNK